MSLGSAVDRDRSGLVPLGQGEDYGVAARRWRPNSCSRKLQILKTLRSELVRLARVKSQVVV